MSSKNFVTTRVMSLLFCVMARGNELWLLLSFGWKFTFSRSLFAKIVLATIRVWKAL